MNATTESKPVLPPLKQDDKLYTVVWNTGDLEVVTFIIENIALGAKVPTFECRKASGQRFRCSPDMYQRTAKEAYAKFIADMEICLPDLKNQIALAIVKEREARALLRKVKALHKKEK